MAAIVMCGSVSSMKALWETKIQNVRDHWEKQSKRPRGRLSVGIWEDRETLARLKEKLATEDGRLVLRLEHEEWKALPGCLVQLSQVQEWQIHRCGLQKIPSFISSFQNLLVLDLSRNGVAEIPKQIGGLTRLRELLLSYNRVQFVPEELSNCESLERLELAMNRDLHQLPDQVKVFFFSLLSIFVGPRWIGSSTQPFKDACSYACLNATCKKHEQNQLLSKLRCLQHLDLSMNLFSVVPPCVLRMPALEWLDMAGNCLHSLPEDINTMEKLHALWLQRNQLEKLPENISRMPSLDTLVLSSNRLSDIPPMMEDMSNLRFVNFRDNPLTLEVNMSATMPSEDDDREMFGRDFMLMYIQEARKRAHAALNVHRVAC
ncbi:leucine-rich repeat-containing protein 39 isoform X1 [Dunckerocampus dactyliophorus]|uniref:leucine-rich repeat-containing protein 39 isoform X1 n=1 Tax=Dunckerocampus dactyliophorus TaxID=161453 RepID=UPI002404FE40|nr:leucine-rich repeat-containing protein 39 isoform X1 [Dunckerocampus dactyliophorus]XP_054644483.1 leucine-rich repeat-containing protein 39 isoform X1 [Dunckerocampus dactyliophorus]XP_054644484.1 leucine-rich repeat-containing protein 39 isoform X1 [Dunckerocampus dactyliophorus]